MASELMGMKHGNGGYPVTRALGADRRPGWPVGHANVAVVPVQPDGRRKVANQDGRGCSVLP